MKGVEKVDRALRARCLGPPKAQISGFRRDVFANAPGGRVPSYARRIGSRCRSTILLQPHATKSLRTVPTRILSIVAKNQYPGLVPLAYNHDCFRIEIAEINPDVFWLCTGLPPKSAGGFCVGLESINEIPGNDQEAVIPGNHIAHAQPVEIKQQRIAEFGPSTSADHFFGVKQRNEQCVSASAFWISKSDP